MRVEVSTTINVVNLERHHSRFISANFSYTISGHLFNFLVLLYLVLIFPAQSLISYLMPWVSLKEGVSSIDCSLIKMYSILFFIGI